MANNFGFKTREMGKAGTEALKQAVRHREIGKGTEKKYNTAWLQFAAFAKKKGIRKMEYVTHDLVKQYGKTLADEVAKEGKAAGYAQDQLSAVNSVMNKASSDQFGTVSAVNDCGIPKVSAIKTSAPAALGEGMTQKAIETIQEKLGDRSACIAEIARELGARAREASLLNARVAYQQAKETGFVTFNKGCKNGQERTIPVNQKQTAVLGRAAAVQGAHDKSMIPSSQSYKNWVQNDIKAINKVLHEVLHEPGVKGDVLHGLRAAYACEQYQERSGHSAPVINDRDKVSWQENKDARAYVSELLGHHREDILNSYVGKWSK